MQIHNKQTNILNIFIPNKEQPTTLEERVESQWELNHSSMKIIKLIQSRYQTIYIQWDNNQMWVDRKDFIVGVLV